MGIRGQSPLGKVPKKEGRVLLPALRFHRISEADYGWITVGSVMTTNGPPGCTAETANSTL